MFSHKLSQRLSKYIGVNEGGPWGFKGTDLPLDSVNGHSPWATSLCDFSTIACPSATAFAATPLNWTVTDTGTAASLVSNPSNSYLHVNPGTAADTGYNLQLNKSNVVPKFLHQYTTTPQTTIAAGREIFWGARVALSCDTTWDGKLFMGLGVTDTACMDAATGALDGLANGVGFHIGEGGTINLVSIRGSSATTSTLSATAATLKSASASWTAGNFHDFAFYAKWATTAGSTTAGFINAYLDGTLVASITGATLPALSTNSLYNTIEFLNGPTGLSDLGVANILNATARLHLP